MGAEENKEVVRKAFGGTGADDLLAALADDVRWTIFGDTTFSGTFNGKQELQERLWGRLFAQLAEAGTTVLDLVIGEGEHVVAQLHATDRVAKSGAPYNNHYCIVFHFRDGKIAEADEYMDTELINKAFGPPPTL
jgi:ketosteroid isomerase-like protein